MEQQKEVQTYAYDSFGQLIRENNQALDKTFIYSYNNIGNITNVKAYAYTTAETPSGSYTQKAYAYHSTYPDRLITYGNKSISYNSLGCPVAYGNKLFSWTNGKLTRTLTRIQAVHRKVFVLAMMHTETVFQKCMNMIPGPITPEISL